MPVKGYYSDRLLVGLSIDAANPVLDWASDSTHRNLTAAQRDHADQQRQESAAIAELEVKLLNAHPDAHEMLEDRLAELRISYGLSEAKRQASMTPFVQAVESAKVRRAAMWQGLVASFTWAHGVVITGLISLGIGQMIAAFRDMAINSYLRKE
jgi:hypothetical protein